MPFTVTAVLIIPKSRLMVGVNLGTMRQTYVVHLLESFPASCRISKLCRTPEKRYTSFGDFVDWNRHRRSEPTRVGHWPTL